MFCRHCGSKIDDNALFCNNCGAKIEVSSKQMSLPISDMPFKDQCKKSKLLFSISVFYFLYYAAIILLWFIITKSPTGNINTIIDLYISACKYQSYVHYVFLGVLSYISVKRKIGVIALFCLPYITITTSIPIIDGSFKHYQTLYYYIALDILPILISVSLIGINKLTKKIHLAIVKSLIHIGIVVAFYIAFNLFKYFIYEYEFTYFFQNTLSPIIAATIVICLTNFVLHLIYEKPFKKSI